MRKINYKLKEVRPSIFAVIIKDKYDRAMTFCRVQEYYESPSPKFRGKQFSIWDYMKWYAEKTGNGFSYANDWSGFNVPVKVIRDCYNGLNKYETPYDKVMGEIIQRIAIYREGYVIGCNNTKDETFKHEVCHALYYTNKDYKKKMDTMTKGLPKKYYDVLKANLMQMGYAQKVINDEIQAYLQYGYATDSFRKGIDISVLHEYNEIYQNESHIKF